MPTSTLTAALCLALAPPAAAQAPPAAFDAATVRIVDDPHPQNIGRRQSPSHLSISGLPLREVIAYAYRVEGAQVIAPDWMATTRVEINATLPPRATPDAIREMLRTLLGERFALKVRTERRETTALALTPGSAAARLTPAAAPAAPVAGGEADELLSGGPAGVSGVFGVGSSYVFANGIFEGKGLTMPMLAAALERYAERPIDDRTGIAGAYDVRFALSAEEGQAMMFRLAANIGMQAMMPPSATAIMAAAPGALASGVQQLGLKLEPRRSLMDVIVVDGAERTPREP